MTHLFISHSSRDGAAIAQPLAAALESAGHRCWIAPRDVKPGVAYPGQIVGAIRDCAGLILVLTPAANESQDVLQEVQRASKHRRVIAPVVVDDTTPTDDLDYYLAVRHQIRWSDAGQTALELLRTFPMPIHVPDKSLRTEVEHESPAVVLQELQQSQSEIHALEQELDTAMKGLVPGTTDRPPKSGAPTSLGATKAHDLLRRLKLKVVSGGPSNRYPRGIPGPADGYRFWATHLIKDRIIQFGAQRINGVFDVQALMKLRLVGFKARDNDKEIFIEIDESLNVDAVKQAERAMRELNHLLSK